MRGMFGRGAVSHLGSRALCGLCACLAALACAGDLVPIPGGYQHRRHGYSVGDPNAPRPGDVASPHGPRWEAFEVPGAVLAFRRPGPQLMSLQSVCKHTVATPAVMARQLLIGVDRRSVRVAGPILLAGADGWMQTFETRLNGVAVTVKTVTVVVNGCNYDWVLTVAGPFDQCEREFDAWWQSFRLDAEPDERGR